MKLFTERLHQKREVGAAMQTDAYSRQHMQIVDITYIYIYIPNEKKL